MSWACTLLGLWCTSGTLIGPAHVWDGDTLTVQGQAVRLAGIDAEELSEPHGFEARTHLDNLVAGKIVTCDWSGYSYKRVVGVCYLPDRQSINARMVADGYALDCAHYSRGLYRSLEPAGARMKLIQKLYCIKQ